MKTLLSGYKVTLKRVVRDDLEMLREWRNHDKIKAFMLSQENISAEQQVAWFEKIQQSNNQAHYVIYYKDEAIGSANIRAVNTDNLQTASVIEPGLYIFADQYRSNLLAFAPTLLLNDYCFNELQIEYLQAVVKADNHAALSYNQKLGYRRVEPKNNNKPVLTIQLRQADYENACKQIKGLLSR